MAVTYEFIDNGDSFNINYLTFEYTAGKNDVEMVVLDMPTNKNLEIRSDSAKFTDIFINVDDDTITGIGAGSSTATQLRDALEAIFFLDESGGGSSTLLTQISSTGHIEGCEMSIEGGNLTIAIASGIGVVVDNYTNPSSPADPITVNYAGATGIVPIGLGVSPVTFFLIDKDGVILQQFMQATAEQRRDYWWSGFCVHLGATIDSVDEDPVVISDINLSVSDFNTAIGEVANGQKVSANSTDMTLQISEGTYTINDINWYNNRKVPNTVTLPSIAGFNWIDSYQDGSGGTTRVGGTTVLVANLYDDGSGILDTVTTNQWTVRRLFRFINGDFNISYGQATYNSFDDAAASLQVDTEQPILDPFVKDQELRTYIIVRGGATDASLTADVVFVPTGRFGKV